MYHGEVKKSHKEFDMGLGNISAIKNAPSKCENLLDLQGPSKARYGRMHPSTPGGRRESEPGTH